jgi:hypothetical protein
VKKLANAEQKKKEKQEEDKQRMVAEADQRKIKRGRTKKRC